MQIINLYNSHPKKMLFPKPKTYYNLKSHTAFGSQLLYNSLMFPRIKAFRKIIKNKDKISWVNLAKISDNRSLIAF